MSLRRRVSRGTVVLLVQLCTLCQALLTIQPQSTTSESFLRGHVPRVLSPTAHAQPLYSRDHEDMEARVKKSGARCLRCAALVLGVSTDSVCEAGDCEAVPASGGAQDIVQHVDGGIARRTGGEESTVLGEIVLSDWLDELPLTSLGLPDVGDEIGQQGRVEVMPGRPRSSQPGGGEEQQVGAGSAPFRFQQLIQVTRAVQQSGLYFQHH